MDALEIQNILVTLNDNGALSPVAAHRVQRALAFGLPHLLKKKNRLKIDAKYPYRIHVEIISSSKMAKLNHIFRGKKGPTDVLTFARWEAKGPFPSEVDLVDRDLGDILVAWEMAKKQAARFNNTYLEELERLTIHGLLHLFGYDHEAGGKAEKVMFALQDAILKSIKKRA